MATIQIQDPIRPTREDLPPPGTAHGIYSMRSPSTGSFPRRTRSFSRTATDRRSHKEQDVEEDAGLQQESDFKQKQVFTGGTLFWLAYQSIGAIYGDIGTSPLYVFSGTFTASPSYDDLVGVLSLIIWSVTMMVTVKYVIVILHADNDGEGGTFSTYSLLSRYANITNRDPREASLVKMQRYKTQDLAKSTRTMRHNMENSKFVKGLLKTIGVLAVSMVMSDGILTPSQSVLGAVQGLAVISPTITNGQIVGGTCGILIFLYLIQPLGLTKLATAFAPIIIIWLGFNGGFGIYNLVKYDHSVLKAFSPSFAIQFLMRNKTDGWRMLGGVLLAFTGVEALFADLGAFSMRAIQISWLGYCYPLLLITYCGQAAYLSVYPAAYTNPLYNSVPPGMLYPTLIIAILAAIVASQAIITATFQLITQIMKLSYFPQIKVVHVSKTFHGQVFVPMLNWLMMVGTVLVAAIYNNTTSLGNAYGVCVIFVTFFDSCMVALAAILVWRIHPALVFFPWLTIACLDGLFLSSALTKVPDGAWFTLTLAAVLAGLFILWRFGKESQWAAEADDRFQPNVLVKKTDNGKLVLTDRYGGTELSPVRGFGIFFDKAGEMSPTVWIQFLSKLVAVPEVMVFFHLRPLETPSVPIEDRYTVTRIGNLPRCYRLVVRHGYMDEVITPNLASLIFEQVRDFIVRKATNRERIELEERAEKRLSEKDGATVTLADSTTPSDSSERSQQDKTSADADADDVKPTATTTGTDNTTTDSSNPNSKNKSTTSLQRRTDSREAMESELAALQHAFDTQSLYIIGKESLRIKDATNLFRSVVLKAFLFIRENTRTKIANLRVPTERVVEVGFVKEI